MKSNQARSLFRILAAVAAAVMAFATLLIGFGAIARGDVQRVAGSLVTGLLAMLFTFVPFKGEAPRWLYVMFTWGERP